MSEPPVVSFLDLVNAYRRPGENARACSDRIMIEEALRRNGGNKSAAAKQVGCSVRAVYNAVNREKTYQDKRLRVVKKEAS